MSEMNAGDLQEFAEASAEWRANRRSRERRDRWIMRGLLAAAVLGCALCVYYVMLPYPAEYWYLGLLGVVLMVPYLTRRID